MKNIISCLLVLLGTSLTVKAQNVDLTNGINYIRVQPVGQSGFSRAFGLNSSNELYIGSVEQTISNMYFFNKGTGYLMTLTPNGNLGIGTTTPNSLLDLGTKQSDPSFFPNKITLWSGGKNNYFGFGVSRDDLDYFSQANHRFYTGYKGKPGSEKMVITSAGSVGIGTTNPTEKLQVNGNQSIYDGDLVFNNSTANQVESGTLRWNEYANNSNKGGAYIKYDGGANYLQFFTNTETVNYEHMRIYRGGAISLQPASGNVGIGTATPNKKLEIKGGDGVGIRLFNENANTWDILNSTNGKLDFVRGGSNTFMSIDQIGRVGIGTTTPSSKLFVQQSSDDSNGGFSVSDVGGSRKIQLYSEGAGGRQVIGTTTSNPLVFDLNGVEKVRFNSNGSVGIGTTTSGNHKLAVEGSIGAREVKVEASGWSDFVFENDYNLPTLKEVAQHIQEKGHLKDIPSAKEVEENGIFLGEMDAKLLQKIEELTLYTLEQEEKIKKLEKKNDRFTDLSEKMLALQIRLEKIENSEK